MEYKAILKRFKIASFFLQNVDVNQRTVVTWSKVFRPLDTLTYLTKFLVVSVDIISRVIAIRATECIFIFKQLDAGLFVVYGRGP